MTGHNWARLEQGLVGGVGSLGVVLNTGFLKWGTQPFSFCLFASPFLSLALPQPLAE